MTTGASIIQRFGKTVPRKRYAGGGYVAGRFQPGAETVADIRASIQPMTAEQLNKETGGEFKTGGIKVLTTDALFTGDEPSGRQADVISWNGKDWEVVRCDPYTMGTLDHFRGYAVLVTRGA